MKSHNLLVINSIEDLKKILFLQKTISQQAQQEMLAIMGDSLIYSGGDGESEERIVEDAKRLFSKEKQLLEKYASYPTLTEFALQPKLGDASKWGATFGVALICGELIFEQVKAMQPHFESVIRQMFILLLNELDHPNPENKYLIDPLVKALKFNVDSEDGTDVSSDKKLAYIQALVNKLVEDFLLVSIEYGLVESKPTGYAITVLGRRVMFHLMDATKYMDEMTKAHERFQTAKPKLAMI